MNFKIGKAEISNERVCIIAEAGVNFNNDLSIAEKLIKEAKNTGADIIKFQTYKAEKLVMKNAPRFWDWEGELKSDGSQFDSYKALDSFGFKEFSEIKKICDNFDIEFMSTPFDEESVDMLIELGVKGFKIASCDITNFPLIKYISNKKLPILLSTGASNIKEIGNALNLIKNNGNPSVCIMQCTLCYPTEIVNANLNSITDIKKNFPEYIIGLSDHTLGVLTGPASILLGVRVIEKHYTIDKSLGMSADHWLSVDPQELNSLVNNSKDIFKSIGNSEKFALECEIPTLTNARRSLVTKKELKKGSTVSLGDLIALRPGTGIPPNELEKIIGKKTNRDIPTNSMIKYSDFE